MKTSYKSTYRVRKGDTLKLIGKALEVQWNLIYYLNKQSIGSNPDIVQIGDQLSIPSPLVVSCWNQLMQSQQVGYLTADWRNESQNVARLLEKSTQVSSQQQLDQACKGLKMDLGIGKRAWKMRIENGPNPWKQIVGVMVQMIGVGIPNESYVFDACRWD